MTVDYPSVLPSLAHSFRTSLLPHLARLSIAGTYQLPCEVFDNYR